MKDSPFYKQADLLLRVLPVLASEPDFALHGGTAINFFIRDFPRLSVDIDLTYLPLAPRADSLSEMSEKLKKLAKKIHSSVHGIKVSQKEGEKLGQIVKLFLNLKGALIKIEPNQVIRGALFPCEEHDLSEEAQEMFEKFVSVKTLAFADLYGSKICAALDRQHPRDLFDTKLLLENEGVTEKVRKAFLVYLISHRRPMLELLNPKWQEMRSVFESEFSGMARIPVSYEDLEKVRSKLLESLRSGFTESERRFLVSFKKGTPEWTLLGVEASHLPAVQWKLANIKRIEKGKHGEAVGKLEKVLCL